MGKAKIIDYAKGYSAKSVKTQKSVLKMIFDYAITRDGAEIIYNPVASVVIPRGLPKKNDLHRTTT